MEKQKAIRIMNRIVKLVRERHRVSFATACYECEIAPSTLYGYVQMITEMFPDIKYKEKEFFIEPISYKES